MRHTLKGYLCLFFLLLLASLAAAQFAQAQDSLRIQRVNSSATYGQAPPTANSLLDTSEFPSPAPPIRRNQFSDAGANFPRTTVTVHAQPQTTSSLNGGITTAELKLLSTHDVVVVIDKSGSMSTPDCPAFGSGGTSSAVAAVAGILFGRPGGGGTSRWEWCRQQTLDLARQISQAFPNGITLVLFSTRYQVFTHANIQQIADIFNSNRPGGSTNATAAMEAIFRDYFQRRDQNPSGKVRPLDIAVITDGAPDNPRSLISSIVNATRQMNDPREIAITFLQIGDEEEARSLFGELTSRLQSEGALYNIVRVRSFQELLQTGLPKSLVQAIS